jgi:hypothetical protein
MSARNPISVDPESRWRLLITNRCEWQTMIAGSWRYLSPWQLVHDIRVSHESETFGPPLPAEPAHERKAPDPMSDTSRAFRASASV